MNLYERHAHQLRGVATRIKLLQVGSFNLSNPAYYNKILLGETP